MFKLATLAAAKADQAPFVMPSMGNVAAIVAAACAIFFLILKGRSK